MFLKSFLELGTPWKYSTCHSCKIHMNLLTSTMQQFHFQQVSYSLRCWCGDIKNDV